MSLLHARELPALVELGDTRHAVRAPAPGWFHRLVAADHLVAPGDTIGELEVLGRVARVLVPRGRGLVRLPEGERLARRPVAYGELLFHLDAEAALVGAGETAEATAAAPAATGLVFRAPTSGRYYGRPSPDKPPFITPGAELTPGTTVCLLEVMKTFHRVAYGGTDVPPRARVSALLVADGADVNAGDPLLALDAP